MGKMLVIVESPAKAKTINKYLGGNYIVKSSVGHIRDLRKHQYRPDQPDNKKRTSEEVLAQRLGMDPYHDWQADYVVMPGKEKVVNELKEAAKRADHIYLASDHDREGEAIAWHLRQILGGDDSKYSRVVFNEITKSAIHKAFKSPGQIDMGSVNAQQTRRFLDRIVGFMVSPVLINKIGRGLSAGRVQSVAVKMIVEREREIKQFVPEEYWTLDADLSNTREQLRLQVTHHQGREYRPATEDLVQQDIKVLTPAEYRVTKCETKPTSSKAPAPFTTSTLQQDASGRLGFGVKKTMTLAQRLYEAGHITYMRTDSTNLSQDALAMVRGYIGDKYGAKYLPEKPNYYGSKANAQEAHEAIRPSDVNKQASHLSEMEPDAQKLYRLIWSRFVGCQMTPALYDSTTIQVEADQYQLRTKGRTVRFDGWTKVIVPNKKSDEDTILPVVKVGEVLRLKQLTPTQHFTKPTGRYSDASLVKELEKRGIGRPSTYAAIITTIQDRGYVRVENRRFFANKMGEVVTNRLEQSFTELMDYNFTAKMEENLDQIAHHQVEWKQLLTTFFTGLVQKIALAGKPYEEGGMRPSDMVLTPITCPKCSKPMGIKIGTSGVFLGCVGYRDKTTQCKTTLPLVPVSVVANNTDDVDELAALRERKRCGRCGMVMDVYLLDPQRKLHICGDNPVCDGVEIELGSFETQAYTGPSVQCEKCGSQMQIKLGKFGKYVGCSNAECKNTRKLLRNGDIAPPRMDPIPMPDVRCSNGKSHFVLREGSSGLFVMAHDFPKTRDIRPPYIDELIQYKSFLPKAFHYLTEAPVTDDEGRRTLVNTDRKTGQAYISSRTDDNKPSGWIRRYKQGKWE